MPQDQKVFAPAYRQGGWSGPTAAVPDRSRILPDKIRRVYMNKIVFKAEKSRHNP
jgi:hypothetical protein